MIRKVFITCFACVSLFSSIASAEVCSTTGCAQALPTSDPGFCASFKSSATCHCTSSGLPKGMCSDMKKLYSRMISMFGSLQKACQYQHDTSTQTCIDDWNCYNSGGNDSQGRACSSTGRSCF